MTMITLTIDQLIALEVHTSLTTDFSGEDTRALRVHLTSEGRISYDINGANQIALGNWSGMEWEELMAWASLSYGVAEGDIVFDKQTGDIYLAYQWDEEDQFAFVARSTGNAQKEGWSDNSGNALEGVTEGEYRLPYDFNAQEDRPAYWQKNADVNSPSCISDWVYNAGQFQLRNA